MRRSRFLLAVVLALVGCQGPRPTNVVVVVVDTLRSDHLGCYGYPRPTSPNLDRLAASAHVFDSAVAQSSWTSPSIASLFTSLYPSAHGVTGFGSSLADEFITLAEILEQHGLRTAGFSANMAFINPDRGFDQGFETFEVLVRRARPEEKDQKLFGKVPAAAEFVTDRALRFLEEAGDGPFFLYLHYIDPHSPYTAPAPYRDAFVAAADTASDGTDRDLFGYGGSIVAGQDDVDHLTALYDAEIAYTDAQMGRLFEHLESTGRLDDTIVVVTSDHGEELFDHGGFAHGTTLYREQVQIPLVVRLPGDPGKGRRAQQTVELVDIGPTILDCLGLEDPRPTPGTSFRSSLRRQGALALLRSRVASITASAARRLGLGVEDPGQAHGYSELEKVTKKADDPRHSRALLSAGWHYLVDHRGDEQLFDVRQDPGETDDHSSRQPGVVAAMRGRLTDLAGSDGSRRTSTTPEETLSDQERERLRALGYSE